MTHLHAQITRTYAEWTALSATRSRAPVKKAAAICPALGQVPFVLLFGANAGPITMEAFDAWHQGAVRQLDAALGRGVGWSAKLINVYLKTRAYVARAGRSELNDALHPPVDGGL
jgi:hypothetical protein